MARLQQVMFKKNLVLLGGALLLTHFGSGPGRLDQLRPAPTRPAAPRPPRPPRPNPLRDTRW